MNDDLRRTIAALPTTSLTVRGVYDDGTLAYRLFIGKAFAGTQPLWGPCPATDQECAATITEATPGRELGVILFTATCADCGRHYRCTIDVR